MARGLQNKLSQLEPVSNWHQPAEGAFMKLKSLLGLKKGKFGVMGFALAASVSLLYPSHSQALIAIFAAASDNNSSSGGSSHHHHRHHSHCGHRDSHGNVYVGSGSWTAEDFFVFLFFVILDEKVDANGMSVTKTELLQNGYSEFEIDSLLVEQSKLTQSLVSQNLKLQVSSNETRESLKEGLLKINSDLSDSYIDMVADYAGL